MCMCVLLVFVQVCVMIHSGSRGLGHQVATDALVEMEAAMARDGIKTNDRQLACARISSKEGQVCMCSVLAGCTGVLHTSDIYTGPAIWLAL